MSKEERDKSKKKRFCYKKNDKECPESYDMGGGSELLLTKGVGFKKKKRTIQQKVNSHHHHHHYHSAFCSVCKCESDISPLYVN